MLVISASVLGVIWSIISLNDASLNIREKDLGLYEADELLWNSTYLEQMKGININIIKDGSLYT